MPFKIRRSPHREEIPTCWKGPNHPERTIMVHGHAEKGAIPRVEGGREWEHRKWEAGTNYVTDMLLWRNNFGASCGRPTCMSDFQTLLQRQDRHQTHTYTHASMHYYTHSHTAYLQRLGSPDNCEISQQSQQNEQQI